MRDFDFDFNRGPGGGSCRRPGMDRWDAPWGPEDVPSRPGPRSRFDRNFDFGPDADPDFRKAMFIRKARERAKLEALRRTARRSLILSKILEDEDDELFDPAIMRAQLKKFLIEKAAEERTDGPCCGGPEQFPPMREGRRNDFGPDFGPGRFDGPCRRPEQFPPMREGHCGKGHCGKGRCDDFGFGFGPDADLDLEFVRMMCGKKKMRRKAKKAFLKEMKRRAKIAKLLDE